MHRWIAWWAMVVAVLCAPAVASPSGPPGAPFCYATGSPSESLVAIGADPARWRCDGTPSLGAERAVLRFPVAAGVAAPRYFSTRTSILDAVTLAVVRDGRVAAQRHFPADTIRVGPQGTNILLPIPLGVRAGDSVLVALDGYTSRGQFHDARLVAVDPSSGHDAMIGLLLAAIVSGMLIMPLAFNAAYYRVLQEKFVIWHLGLSLSLLTQCLLNSGIIGHFVTIPLPVFARIGTISFGISIAAAAAFGAAFIEPRKLDPRLRQALYWCAAQVLTVTAIQTIWAGALGPLQTPLYYASFLPVLAVFFMVLGDAWMRGSRAVRFQLVGWAPFLAVGIIRMVTMLVPAFHYNDAMVLFYAAVVVESVAISLGVADRFMTIRRQRDRALDRAHSLERLSERDDLTGLYNRRALAGPLGDFATQRYAGFALFDLDNFKRVNDSHGHAVGDEVLRIVASVLDGHQNATALRLGGEEFLLLLRGSNVAERVERLREAIPVRIAREVGKLEALVTASAGLVEAEPGADIGSDFFALYHQADDLLYEAKHNGRNLLAAVQLRSAAVTGDLAAA